MKMCLVVVVAMTTTLFSSRISWLIWGFDNGGRLWSVNGWMNKTEWINEYKNRLINIKRISEWMNELKE